MRTRDVRHREWDIRRHGIRAYCPPSAGHGSLARWSPRTVYRRTLNEKKSMYVERRVFTTSGEPVSGDDIEMWETDDQGE